MKVFTILILGVIEERVVMQGTLTFLSVCLFVWSVSFKPVWSCGDHPMDDGIFRPLLTTKFFTNAAQLPLLPDVYLPVPDKHVPAYTFEVKLHEQCLNHTSVFLNVVAVNDDGEHKFTLTLRRTEDHKLRVTPYIGKLGERNSKYIKMALIQNGSDTMYILHFMLEVNGQAAHMLISADNCASNYMDIEMPIKAKFIMLSRENGCRAAFVGTPTFPGWFTPSDPEFVRTADDSDDEDRQDEPQTEEGEETHMIVDEDDHPHHGKVHAAHDEGDVHLCGKCTKELGGDIGKNDVLLEKLSKTTVATQYTMALFVILFGFILFGIMKAWSSAALSLSVIQMVKDDMKTFTTITSQTATDMNSENI